MSEARARPQAPQGFIDWLARVLATWFGCGLVPKAPGTVGTLGALPLYLLLVRGGPLVVAAGALAVTLLAVAVSHRVVRLVGMKDPQIICIDEVAGVLVPLAVVPRTLGWVAAAVVLFRLFDITKPPPARACERLPGGWGVVMDDVVAGLWAAVLLVGARLVFGRFFALGGVP
jgi:phosphatidylglycerophosphatase A